MFLEDEDHRRKFNFKHQYAQTALEQMCISVYDVKLWNFLENDLKGNINICQFEKMYEEKILENMKFTGKVSFS